MASAKREGYHCCCLGPHAGQSADHAASAALFVTHPERRVVTRDPDIDALDTETTGFSIGRSRASAGAAAALAHIKSRPDSIWGIEAQQQLPLGGQDQDLYASEIREGIQISPQDFHAALSAARDLGPSTEVPPLAVNLATGRPRQGGANVRFLEPTGADRAASGAASGAYSSSRRRAESALAQITPETDTFLARSAAGVSHRYSVELEDPLDRIGPSVEATRMQHLRDPDRQRYTSHPLVARETEEAKRDSVRQAAATSMARDMYSLAGARTDQGPAFAVNAAQVGHGRVHYKEPSIGETSSRKYRRGISLQSAAQKLASDKLSKMQEEDLYHEYYGTGQPERRRLSRRLRRTPSEADSSRIDTERSREIRDQMTSLQNRMSKLDQRKIKEQDEKRKKDRDELMEIARRNVQARIQDMESRVYVDRGMPSPAQQREWEEIMAERARIENEAHVVSPDSIHIGANQFMNRAEVEAIARTRIQPTLDEIGDREDEQRAKRYERFLDKKEAQRREALERRRDAETKAEEKRLKDIQKRNEKEKAKAQKEKKAKEESQESDELRQAYEEELRRSHRQPEAARAEERENRAATSAPAPLMNMTEPAEASQAQQRQIQEVREEFSPPQSPRPSPRRKKESRLKALFKRRRRGGTPGAFDSSPSKKEKEREKVSEKEREKETEKEKEREKEKAPERPRERTSSDDRRLAPLGSHPVHRYDGKDTERRNDSRNESTDSSHQRVFDSFQQSFTDNEPRMSRRDIHDQEANGHSSRSGKRRSLPDASQVSGVEQEALRDSAARQGLPEPPSQPGKASDSSPRESRFSEDL